MSDGHRLNTGRSRKWASAAERSRAYRARKARELAEPERLRRDLQLTRAALRVTKRELARQVRLGTKLEHELATATARAAATDRKAQIRIEALERRVAALTTRAEATEDRCERLSAALRQPRPAPSTVISQQSLFAAYGTPPLNRAQRRAQARQQ